MGVFREFFLIVTGGFIGAGLGGLFGAFVGFLFPDFVALLFNPVPIGSAVPIAGGMGMVLGLPIGAMAMAAGRFVGAIRWWAGIREGNDRPTEPADEHR